MNLNLVREVLNSPLEQVFLEDESLSTSAFKKLPSLQKVFVSNSILALTLSNGSLIAFSSSSSYMSLKGDQRGFSDDEISTIWKHVQGIDSSLVDPILLVADPGSEIISVQPFEYDIDNVFSSLLPVKSVSLYTNIQSLFAIRQNGEVLLWMKNSDLDEGATIVALEAVAQSQQQQQQQQRKKKQQTALAAAVPSSSSSSSSSLFQREETKEAYGGFSLVCSINVFESGLIPSSKTKSNVNDKSSQHQNNQKNQSVYQAFYNVFSENLYLVCEIDGLSQVFSIPFKVKSNGNQDNMSNTNSSSLTEPIIDIEISPSKCIFSSPGTLTLFGSNKNSSGIFISSLSTHEISYFNHNLISEQVYNSENTSSSTSSSSSLTDGVISTITNSNELPPVHLPIFTTTKWKDIFSRARSSIDASEKDKAASIPVQNLLSPIGSQCQIFAYTSLNNQAQDNNRDDTFGAACFIESNPFEETLLVVSLKGRLYSVIFDKTSSTLFATLVSTLEQNTQILDSTIASRGWSDVTAITGMTIVGPSVYFTVIKTTTNMKQEEKSISTSLLVFDIATGLAVSCVNIASDYIFWKSTDETISGCSFSSDVIKSGIKTQIKQFEQFLLPTMPVYASQLSNLMSVAISRGMTSLREKKDESSLNIQRLVSKSFFFRMSYGNSSNALSIFNGDYCTDNINKNTNSNVSSNLNFKESTEKDGELVIILRDLIKSSWHVTGKISSIDESTLSDLSLDYLNTAVTMACDVLDWAVSLRDSGFQSDLSMVRSLLVNKYSSSASTFSFSDDRETSSADILFTGTISSSSSSSSSSASSSIQEPSSTIRKRSLIRSTTSEFLNVTLSECFNTVSCIWARLVTLAPGLGVAVGVGANNGSDSTKFESASALHKTYVAPTTILKRTVQLLRSLGITKQQLEWTVGLRLAGDGTALPQKQARLLPPISPPASDLSASLPPVAGVPSGKGIVRVRLPSKQFFETTSDLIDDVLAINRIKNDTSFDFNNSENTQNKSQKRLSSASNGQSQSQFDRSRDGSTESSVQTYYDNRAGDNITVQQHSNEDDVGRVHIRREGMDGVEVGEDDSDDEDTFWDELVPSELQTLWAGAKRLHMLLLPKILLHLKTQLHIRALIGREDAVDASMSNAHAAIVLSEDSIAEDSNSNADMNSIIVSGRSLSFPPALSTGGGVELNDDDLIILSEKASQAALNVFSGQVTVEDMTTLRQAREAFFRLRILLTGYKSVMSSDMAALARSLIHHPKRKITKQKNQTVTSVMNENADNSQFAAVDDDISFSAPSLVAEAPMNFEHVIRFAYASSIYSWHATSHTISTDTSFQQPTITSVINNSSPPHFSRAQSRAISIHTVDVINLLEAYHSQVPATWRGELPPAIKSHMRLEVTQKKINVTRGNISSNVTYDVNEHKSSDVFHSSSAIQTDSYKNTFIRALRALPQPCKVVRHKDSISLNQLWAMRAAIDLLSNVSHQQQSNRINVRKSSSPQPLQQQQLSNQPTVSLVESPPPSSSSLRSKSPAIPSHKSSNSKYTSGPLLSNSPSTLQVPIVPPQTLVHVRILCRVGEFVDALRLLLRLDHWEDALSMLTAAEEADGLSRQQDHTTRGNDARGLSIDHLVTRIITSHPACLSYLEALERGENACDPEHESRRGVKTLKDMETSELLLSFSLLQRLVENPSESWANDVALLASQNLNNLSNLQHANAPLPTGVVTSVTSVQQPGPLLPGNPITQHARRTIQPSTLATQSRLSAMSPSIASVSSLLRWSSSALKRAMCWKALFIHAVDSGCGARVLQCLKRLPPAMSLTSLLAILKSCLTKGKTTNASVLPAWAVLQPLILLSISHAEDIEGMFRHMRSQAMQKNDTGTLRSWSGK